MTQSYFALITVLGGGPGPGTGGNYPDNTLPQPPLGIWGGGNMPYPDQGLPGQQPGIWGPNDPRPSPPIYIPPPGSPPPLGIWGPTDPRPTHPIAGVPPGGVPGQPPGIWGPTDPRPTHPIVLPPNLPPEIPGGPGEPARKVEWKTGWTATTGWVIVGVPAEGTLVPTPSKK